MNHTSQPLINLFIWSLFKLPVTTQSERKWRHVYFFCCSFLITLFVLYIFCGTSPMFSLCISTFTHHTMSSINVLKIPKQNCDLVRMQSRFVYLHVYVLTNCCTVQFQYYCFFLCFSTVRSDFFFFYLSFNSMSKQSIINIVSENA